ncbi:MAG: acyltransferase [Planctomycetia bacterium]|nr:acyltransferase [Planctomycetia bacterium]
MILRDMFLTMGNNANTIQNHISQLDGLRAFAVIFVIVTHTTPHFLPFDIGAFGVRLFFVLSGYLITGILLGTHKAAETQFSKVIITFYIRRFLRIFPLYYLALLIAVIVNLPGIWESAWWHAAYLSNVKMVIEKVTPEVGGHFWSLAVEEQFYLIWPFIVLLTPRKLLPWTIAVAIITAPIFRYFAYNIFYTMMSRFLMPSCLDTLGMGAMLALIQQSYPRFEKRYAILLGASGSLILAYFYFRPDDRIAKYVLTDIASGCLSVAFVYISIASSNESALVRFLSWRPLAYIGTNSYGVYVWQWFIPNYAEYFGIELPEKSWSLFLIVTGVSIVVASLSWFLLEKPLNELKRHFPYPRKQNHIS